jgi:hypothetical protein
MNELCCVVLLGFIFTLFTLFATADHPPPLTHEKEPLLSRPVTTKVPYQDDDEDDWTQIV